MYSTNSAIKHDLVAHIAEKFVQDYAWQSEVIERAEMVKQFRNYYIGKHPVSLNDTMRQVLHRRGSEYWFGVNYCQLVIDELANRLDIETIAVGEDSGLQEYVDAMFAKNDFDTLEGDLHLATIRDGDAFLIARWDNEKKEVRLHLNYAFDGVAGVIPIYVNTFLYSAVKVTPIDSTSDLVIFYYPDRVETMTYEHATSETPVGFKYEPPMEWKPGVLPVIHFANRRLAGEAGGYSELMGILALQDALNASVVTAMGASYLTGFPIGMWKGPLQSKVPDKLGPGGITEFKTDDYQLLSASTFEFNDAPDFAGNIALIRDLVWHISNVSSTPVPMGNEGTSGESQKQVESKLLAKVRKAQIKLGDSWEDVVQLAVKMEEVYGAKSYANAIEGALLSARWKDKQVRNDLEIVDIWRVVYDVVVGANPELAVELFLQGTAEISNLSDSEIEGFDLTQGRLQLEVENGRAEIAANRGQPERNDNRDNRGSKGSTQGGAPSRGFSKEGKRGTPNSSRQLKGRGQRAKDAGGK